MARFGSLFPDLAEREMRSMGILDAEPVEDDPGRPPTDEYGLDEWYCDERGCDCRRVMIMVVARQAKQHVASISYAFEKPAAGAPVKEQAFLDPFNRQSPFAPQLLELFLDRVVDEEYRQRLIRHYHLFKAAVDDPARRRVSGAADGAFTRPGSIPPPPPRSGKRKKWR
jgi:hypothetical protein